MYYHPFAGVRCKTQTSTTKKGINMKLKKFLSKSLKDRKAKIAILKKMLKACDASGTGTVTVTAARKIINEN